MGWRREDKGKIEAIQDVERSTVKAKSGDGSLGLQVNLVSEYEYHDRGEAYVDLRFYPPEGLEAPPGPLDLTGIKVTIWVYARAEAAGNPDTPNGVQVFVKDQDYNTEYGKWTDLIALRSADRWISTTLVPATEPPPGGTMDDDFDPSDIALVGIRIAAGSGYTDTYTGTVWIDDVCWRMP
jgi:hypothetical protein